MASYFHSPAAKKQIETCYWQRLDALGMAYEGQVIETSFGDTHVIQAGPPVVVLHGLEGSAPAALAQLRPLCDHCRLYAIDIIGRPNLSAGFRPEKRGLM
jgi:hypothetical protein